MKRTIMMVAPTLALLACAKGSDSAVDTSSAASTATTVGATTQAATAAGEVQAQLLDPNTATREQLVAAGLDTVAAASLVSGRPYADMVAVDRALPKSVTPDQRKALYARIWKPIDLNTAKADEILLIPGVGRKMLHEFEEYRPYKSMEQFRREIGKYVDKTELARLEQYVSIR